MLRLSDTATDTLREVFARCERHHCSGLRLEVNNDTPGEPGFQLSVVAAPRPGDLVVVVDPPLYVARTAAPVLEGQLLVAEEPNDPASLRIVPQAA